MAQERNSDKAQGEGMFKQVEMNRSTQMAPASDFEE
jgi:hypothetical protein